MNTRLENILQSFKSAGRGIKTYFRHYRGKNVLIFLFFVLLSFSFWVLLSLQEEYEIQVSIPIRYKNMPNDVVFVQTPPTEITARVRDKGTVLLNYSIGNKISVLDIDLTDISTKGGVFVFPAKNVEGTIMKQLISTTNLINFNPTQIEIPYSKLTNKKLPVVFNGDIRTEAGFKVSGEITIEPPYVDVYASDIVLDTLLTISTVFTEIKKGKKTITEELKLNKPEGTTIEPESVTITIPIEEFTEKTLDIPIISKGVPDNFTIRMFPAKVQVICTVPLSRFKELSEEEFLVEASIEDTEQHISGMLSVTLIRKPDWVEDVSLNPSSIEFILEQNNTDD